MCLLILYCGYSCNQYREHDENTLVAKIYQIPVDLIARTELT